MVSNWSSLELQILKYLSCFYLDCRIPIVALACIRVQQPCLRADHDANQEICRIV